MKCADDLSAGFPKSLGWRAKKVPAKL